MRLENPTILTFVEYYLPGFKSGGPVRTIANLVDHLGDEFNFRVVTRDRDSGDETAYADIDVGEWNRRAGTDVFYTPPGLQAVSTFRRLLGETHHDVLYLNSFFSPTFTGLPLLLRRLVGNAKKPVILAPRGEFSRGALKLESWKKQPYVEVAKRSGFYRDVIWHASNDHEAQDIQRAMDVDPTQVKIASNLPPATSIKATEPTSSNGDHDDGRLRLVFLSRISPKKNLSFLLRALEHVTTPVCLDLYGYVDSPEYWNQCRERIGRLPANVRARYHGCIPHTEVHDTLSTYDLFVLPTRGENYGHAIFEALSSGIPVLISDQTPWKDLESTGAGWAVPIDSPRTWAARIQNYAGLSSDERRRHRSAAARYAARFADDEGLVDSNRRLFEEALEHG